MNRNLVIEIDEKEILIKRNGTIIGHFMDNNSIGETKYQLSRLIHKLTDHESVYSFSIDDHEFTFTKNGKKHILLRDHCFITLQNFIFSIL